jgi:hypothetical protein
LDPLKAIGRTKDFSKAAGRLPALPALGVAGVQPQPVQAPACETAGLRFERDASVSGSAQLTTAQDDVRWFPVSSTSLPFPSAKAIGSGHNAIDVSGRCVARFSAGRTGPMFEPP